ncbi:hypothetical protein ES703_86884 [subsurface metagenome]
MVQISLSVRAVWSSSSGSKVAPASPVRWHSRQSSAPSIGCNMVAGVGSVGGVGAGAGAGAGAGFATRAVAGFGAGAGAGFGAGAGVSPPPHAASTGAMTSNVLTSNQDTVFFLNLTS